MQKYWLVENKNLIFQMSTLFLHHTLCYFIIYLFRDIVDIQYDVNFKHTT